MKLYEYWLGLYPLDWEFCFMPVQTYKNFITEQYHKNPTFYNISAGSIEKVLAHIDVILSAAMEDWNNTTNHAALRCPPMIFPLPKGQDSNITVEHYGTVLTGQRIDLPENGYRGLTADDFSWPCSTDRPTITEFAQRHGLHIKPRCHAKTAPTR